MMSLITNQKYNNLDMQGENYKYKWKYANIHDTYVIRVNIEHQRKLYINYTFYKNKIPYIHKFNRFLSG